MQKVLLTGIYIDKSSEDETNELIKAAGCELVASMYQKKDKIDAKYYIGSGKIEEIKEMVDNLNIDLVVFDNELSPSHLNNISRELDTAVIDRNTLILHIFANRSKTKFSKYQVELAQLEYNKTRLKGMGVLMSRQGSGVGSKGPGETKLEMDRRRIDSRIVELKSKIKEQLKNKKLHADSRKKRNIKTVALIGYTNSGKSTLLNKLIEKYELIGDKVFEKDMLFASLDTSSRKIVVDKNFEFLLTDTVGFVSRLPHYLVNGFYSTLSEIEDADLVINVIDCSDKNADAKAKATMDIIDFYHIDESRILTVHNKMDKGKNCVIHSDIDISAKYGENIDDFVELIKEKLYPELREYALKFKYSEFAVLSSVENNYDVIRKDYKDEYVLITVKLDKVGKSMYGEYICK